MECSSLRVSRRNWCLASMYVVISILGFIHRCHIELMWVWFPVHILCLQFAVEYPLHVLLTSHVPLLAFRKARMAARRLRIYRKYIPEGSCTVRHICDVRPHVYSSMHLHNYRLHFERGRKLVGHKMKCVYSEPTVSRPYIMQNCISVPRICTLGCMLILVQMPTWS
jgi:hypothetical protein